MAIQSWQNIIDLIRNGEPVSAEVANRAINQLVQRTEHLKTRQDAQSLAQAIFISGAPLAHGVVTGNAVYFDAQLGKFAAAYADIEFVDGFLRPSATSNVVGIVIYKDTADSGVIVIDGWINPSQYEDLDCDYVSLLDNLLVNPNDRGILYLASGIENAGKLSSKSGFINTPVCNLVSSTNMLIRPPITTVMDTQALRFKLNNNIAAADLILEVQNGGGIGTFSVAAPIAVGTRVKVYLGNSTAITSGNLTADELEVYLTATVEKYVTYSGQTLPSAVHLVDVEFTKTFAQKVASCNGSYSCVFTPINGLSEFIKIKAIGAVIAFRITQPTTVATGSCYVSPVFLNDVSGWNIKLDLIDSTKPGWLPANHIAFANSIKPVGAKFGYNVKQDPLLQQLFPEAVVTAYSITKDGVALSNAVVEVNSSGIWWKDSLVQVPWHRLNQFNLLPEIQINLEDWQYNELINSSLIMPSELHLVYAKLNTGSTKLVTSLETPANSLIKITDPLGNPANSGPLVINADFTINDSSSGISGDGSLVVKDIVNLSLVKGHVVEKITGGDNINITSTVEGGQGDVTISIVGLEGKLEGQPDILAVDDVLVERDPILHMFYSVFPKNKASSILGKIDIPTYFAVDEYKLQLEFKFIALHTGTNQNPPTLTLNVLALPNVTTTKQSLANVNNVSPISVVPYSEAVSSRDYFKKSVEILDSVIPGSCVFFKLSRSSTDDYSTKFGLISTSFKFIKRT